MVSGLAVAVLTLTLAACRDPAVAGGVMEVSAAERAAAETITETDVLARIGVMAHDSMRGRATPSPELNAVARWAAGEFERAGLASAFPDTWIQEYTIRTEVPDFSRSEAHLGERPLRFGESLGTPFGPQSEADVDAPLVVVSGSRGWQDQLVEAGLADRAVLIVGARDEPGPRSREALQMFNAIRDAGPAVILFAVDLPDAEWTASLGLQADEPVTRPLGFAGVPVLSIRDASVAPVLAEHALDLVALRDRAGSRVRVAAVANLRFRASIVNRILESAPAPNVVARLTGSDPELSKEFVLLSAHMDHVGVGRPDVRGDSIYNGADDDASGSATVIEVAEALASLDPAPRRSFLFVLVSGEERGLWGSRWIAENPPVPLDRVVANFNLDMVGRNWDDSIVVIGKEHSDLGRTLTGVNNRHPELRMNAVDDLWPEEGYYFRSDHYNFASRGVPVLFFFNGTHADYHGPGDHVERIDGEKTARIGRLVYYLSVEVANRDARPVWDEASYGRIAGG